MGTTNTTNTNGTMDKKPSEKFRSVDVYHETVRQRATRSTEPVKKQERKNSEHPHTPKKISMTKNCPLSENLGQNLKQAKMVLKKLQIHPRHLPRRNQAKLTSKRDSMSCQA